MQFSDTLKGDLDALWSDQLCRSAHNKLKQAGPRAQAAYEHSSNVTHGETSQKVLNNTTKAFKEDLRRLSRYGLMDFKF